MSEEPKAYDAIDKCIMQCEVFAKKCGLILFRIELGDEETYQGFSRRETWTKYKNRLRKERAEQEREG